LNTSSLLPGRCVLILPAETRYESAGGGTATNTERRIRYTPEIPGPRIAEARPEWRIPVEVARSARPELAPFLAWNGTAEIRDEMARVMPMYAGIDKLERAGQWVQWGGPRLFTDGFGRMPAGRARFTNVSVPKIVIPPGMFHLTTRRGKQFNSITFESKDALMGAHAREEVLMCPADASVLGVSEGDAVRLRSEVGEWVGLVRLAPMKPRHVQTYWPETNVLITRRFDPVSGEPDYNAVVTIEPVGPTGSMHPARVAEPAAASGTSTEPAMARVRHDA
jgi:predicted molibdopterin-dependent oxidoreductase YjgC